MPYFGFLWLFNRVFNAKISTRIKHKDNFKRFVGCSNKIVKCCNT